MQKAVERLTSFAKPADDDNPDLPDDLKTDMRYRDKSDSSENEEEAEVDEEEGGGGGVNVTFSDYQ